VVSVLILLVEDGLKLGKVELSVSVLCASEASFGSLCSAASPHLFSSALRSFDLVLGVLELALLGIG
jgi:hypothetical protein